MPSNWINRRLLTDADAIYDDEGNKIHDLLELNDVGGDVVEVDKSAHPDLYYKLATTTPVGLDLSSYYIVNEKGSEKAGGAFDYTNTTIDKYDEKFRKSYVQGKGIFNSSFTDSGTLSTDETYTEVLSELGTLSFDFSISTSGFLTDAVITLASGGVTVLMMVIQRLVDNQDLEVTLTDINGDTYEMVGLVYGSGVTGFHKVKLYSDLLGSTWALDYEGNTHLLPFDIKKVDSVRLVSTHTYTTGTDNSVSLTMTAHDSSLLPNMTPPTGSSKRYKIIADVAQVTTQPSLWTGSQDWTTTGTWEDTLTSLFPEDGGTLSTINQTIGLVGTQGETLLIGILIDDADLGNDGYDYMNVYLTYTDDVGSNTHTCAVTFLNGMATVDTQGGDEVDYQGESQGNGNTLFMIPITNTTSEARVGELSSVNMTLNYNWFPFKVVDLDLL